jgi:two-component system OmpR family sensor kinase
METKPPPPSLLETLERLLDVPPAGLRVALSHTGDVIAGALRADKVDAFLYDAARDSLFAVGTSNQPLSAQQRRLGLDVLPISNGGRAVQVFQTGATFATGRLDQDPEELLGVKEALAVRSEVGVAVEVGGRRRGVLMIAAQAPDHFTADDVRFVERVARWTGLIVHRSELIEEATLKAHEEGRRSAAEELITVLAHDLRNFIGTVNVAVGVIKRRAESDGRSDDVRDIRRAERGLSRISSLVSDILDVARLDRGLLAMDPRPIDLVPLVQETAAPFSNAQRTVSVQPCEPLIVCADAARVRQSLENLIANAIKHSPEHTEVTITLRREHTDRGHFARIDVIDQGPGIAADILPRIFDRFVTGKDSQAGLGLGLYLARRIATLHGGDLSVTSSPGAGACLSLTIPLYQAPVPERPAQA